MNLWGCACEDLLTRQDSEGRNIVDDYLTRRGWKETATAKRYMTDLRHSVMSLYEVSDIVPGESFLARDLVQAASPCACTNVPAQRHWQSGIASAHASSIWDGSTIPPDTRLSLENGLLHVELVREVPEAMKPRSIPIASSSKLLEVKPTKVAA